MHPKNEICLGCVTSVAALNDMVATYRQGLGTPADQPAKVLWRPLAVSGPGQVGPFFAAAPCQRYSVCTTHTSRFEKRIPMIKRMPRQNVHAVVSGTRRQIAEQSGPCVLRLRLVLPDATAVTACHVGQIGWSDHTIMAALANTLLVDAPI